MIHLNTIKSIGLKVPSVTFGSASIANLFAELTNIQAIEVIEKAIGIGWRYFDTAPHYGSGLAELRLGLGLHQLPRDEYILSTKVGRLLEPRQEDGLEAGDFFFQENPCNRKYDYTYDGIMRSWEDSLQRLGTRRIDILYVHDVGTYTHGKTEQERAYFRDLCQSGFKALETLKAEGHIKGFGVGANEEEIFLEVLDNANPDIIMLANRYNLLETQHPKLFEKCAKHNVSIAVAAPFATGILVAPEKSKGRYEYGAAPQHIIDKALKIDAICREFNVPIGAAALQFPLRNPNVVTVTCGVQSVRQAIDNFAWANQQIPEALWIALAKIGVE